MMVASRGPTLHQCRMREAWTEHRLCASTVRTDQEAPITDPFVHHDQILRPRSDREPLLEIMRIPRAWRFLDFELGACRAPGVRWSLAMIDVSSGINVW